MSEEKMTKKEAPQDEEISTLKEMVEDLRQQLRDGVEESDMDIIDRELAALHDPFNEQNPFKILKVVPPDLCPEPWAEGGKLRWKSPLVRDRRGMRGWRWVTWDSPLAKKLGEYLASPPERMKDTENLDNMIRRGDLALGIIDNKIAKSRMLRSELESAKMRGQLSDSQKKMLGHGVTMSGKGLRRDETGSKIYDPVTEYQSADHARFNMHKKPS